MPESKVRKEELAEKRRERKRLKATTERRWVPWAFGTIGLLGILWMVVWNLAGPLIPFMLRLGGWNVLISLGLILVSFGLATLWK